MVKTNCCRNMPERIADHNRPYSSNLSSCCFISWHCGSNKVLVHESYVRRARSAYLVHKSIFGVSCCDFKVTAYHYDTHFCWSESPIYVFSSHFFPLYLWYFHVAGVSHACRGFSRRALLPRNTRGRRPKRMNSPSFFLRCILGNPRRMMPKKSGSVSYGYFFF